VRYRCRREAIDLREIVTRCEQCGRRRYTAVDAWSGVTDAEIRRGNPLCRRCRDGNPAGGGEFSGRRAQSGGLGAMLLTIGLVVAPIVGVAEALLR
jgi:hypothetical protein